MDRAETNIGLLKFSLQRPVVREEQILYPMPDQVATENDRRRIDRAMSDTPVKAWFTNRRRLAEIYPGERMGWPAGRTVRSAAGR